MGKEREPGTAFSIRVGLDKSHHWESYDGAKGVSAFQFVEQVSIPRI